MIVRGYVIPEEIRNPEPLEIYSTSGLYPNGDFKMNGVVGENLIDYYLYNMEYRPGRAFFVNGKCLYKGIGVSQAQIDFHERILKSDSRYKITRNTAPYS